MGFPEVCCRLSQAYILPLAKERVHLTGLLSSLVWSWDWSHGERMKLHAWGLAQAEVTPAGVVRVCLCVLDKRIASSIALHQKSPAPAALTHEHTCVQLKEGEMCSRGCF